jgi:hypothetical protein
VALAFYRYSLVYCSGNLTAKSTSLSKRQIQSRIVEKPWRNAKSAGKYQKLVITSATLNATPTGVGYLTYILPPCLSMGKPNGSTSA